MIEVKDLSITVEAPDEAAGAQGSAVGQTPEAVTATLLESIDIRVRPGEMVLVTGGSGSGKSSLVNALNGFIPHIRPARIGGDVKVDGLEPAEVELAEAGRVAATVFQNPRTQFFATDVLSEIAFGASNQGVPREEILRRIDAAVDLLDLAHLLDRRMGELSGGERQRVALASAVVSRPSLFLLDEPTANLDDASTQAVAEALAHLKGAGATILVAEHRLHYLRGLVDRVVQLRCGRVVADCPAAEFWEMGEVERRDAGLRSLVAPASDPLPAPPAPADAGGLELRALSAVRDGRRLWAIDEATAPRGAITCVTGPNGVGKSTLVQVLVGLCRAEGTVVLDGKELSRRERRRRCSAVMQDVNRQLFGVSVTDELSLVRAQPSVEEAEAVLAELGLGGMGERHPLSLSGGQRQRLAVATAVLGGEEGRGADVIIFDEPTSGLDLRAMESMAGVIRRCADRGAVVVLVTHDRELVDMVGDFEFPLTAG